jgi:hypothetical protein
VARGDNRLRHTGKESSATRIRYEVACGCGKTVVGFRQAHHQEVVCAGCGQKIFILPFSPLGSIAGRSAKSASRGSRFWIWRRSVAAAAGALLVAIGAIILLTYKSYHASLSFIEPKTFRLYFAQGKRALGQGKFQFARENLEAAWSLRDRPEENLSSAERADLLQLLREARLLADLSAESLEEMLRHAADLIEDEREWHREFSRRYQGKTVLFDTEVRLDPVRQFQMEYVVFVGERPAKMELSNVELFRSLPLDKPRRLIFGLRLANITLEPEGVWSVRFEPDGGVLLTQLQAAAACCMQPVDDLREVIDRQGLWIKRN